MMHLQDFVVSIREAGRGKAFREFKIDDCPDDRDNRIRKIHIPFDQEYEFVFKNMKNVRRSVSIDIDGTEIGTWIISSGTRTIPYETVLERFMDSNKRFKILRLNDSGVDDPSNKENGIINIKVIDEKPHFRPHFELSPLFSCNHESEFTLSASTLSINACNSYSPNAATGEGSNSDQQFSPTSWFGDSSNIIKFKFYVIGVDRKCDNSNVSDQKYCIDCGVKLIKKSKFCHDCGSAILV